jgi:hypothetical protein
MVYFNTCKLKWQNTADNAIVSFFWTGTILKKQSQDSEEWAEIPDNSNENLTYTMSLNYPNPFNPSTMIGYQLPVNSYVNIRIYDVLGKEIKTLVSEYKSAGSYNVEWRPENIPSGVYFYRIQIGKYNEIRKMIFQK